MQATRSKALVSAIVTAEKTRETGKAMREVDSYEAITGRVIMNRADGKTYGALPSQVLDPDVRQATEVLLQRGFQPALVGDDFEEDESATGFLVQQRAPGVVYVFHLEQGSNVHPETRDFWSTWLNQYAAAFRAAGAEVLGRPARCVRVQL